MIRGDTIRLLKISSSPSLLDWCELLTYYQDYKEELNWLEVRLLRCQSEQFRRYFNTDRTEVKQVGKAGKWVDINYVRKGLDINREDVNPDIYSDCIIKSKLLNGATNIITATVSLAIRLAGFRMVRGNLLLPN